MAQLTIHTVENDFSKFTELCQHNLKLLLIYVNLIHFAMTLIREASYSEFEVVPYISLLD